MATAVTDNIVLSLPKEQFFAVTYPGLVKNVTKAISQFPADIDAEKDIVSNTGSSSERVQLQFQPYDTGLHPLPARIRPSNAVLLRVKKSCGTVEVVGRVTRRVDFPGLADFQFIREQQLPAVLPNLMTQDVEGQLNVAPAAFTKFDAPRPYRHSAPPTETGAELGPVEQEFYSKFISLPQAPNIARVKPSAKRVRHRGTIQRVGYISYDVETVPTEPPGAVETTPLLTKLLELFEERPIWSRLALLHHFEDNNELMSVLQLMPYVAFKFAKGPWRSCYVRYGYDPRVEPDARFLQTVELRIKRSHAAMLKIAEPRSSGDTETAALRAAKHLKATDPCVRSVPASRQVTYQYCDMYDLPGVEELLQSAAVNSECHVSHGWFPPRVLLIIRRALQQRVSKWVRSAMTTSAGSTATIVLDDVEMEEVSLVSRPVATSKRGASAKRQERGVMPTGAGKAPKTRKKSAAASVTKKVEPSSRSVGRFAADDDFDAFSAPSVAAAAALSVLQSHGRPAQPEQHIEENESDEEDEADESDMSDEEQNALDAFEHGAPIHRAQPGRSLGIGRFGPIDARQLASDDDDDFDIYGE